MRSVGGGVDDAGYLHERLQRAYRGRLTSSLGWTYDCIVGP